MSYPCYIHAGEDCDGCGDCGRPVGDTDEPRWMVRCELCKSEIADYIYKVEGQELCEDCADRLYRRETPMQGSKPRCCMDGQEIDDGYYYQVGEDVYSAYWFDKVFREDIPMIGMEAS